MAKHGCFPSVLLSLAVLFTAGLLGGRSHCYVEASEEDGLTVEYGRKVVGEFMTETGFYQSIMVNDNSPLVNFRSKYQDIQVHESSYYGKILVLDGVVQLTERDADSYNEMMAHIPMMAHSAPKRVLVVGGGDGMVLSEVLKHPMVEHVDHVDLDEGVINTCKEHFSWGKAWDDPRVTLHIADGAAFVRDAPAGSYDVIVQDSSDPSSWDENGQEVILPSSVLYSEYHLKNLVRALSPHGVFNFQAETFQLPSDLKGISEWRDMVLEVGFESAQYGSLTISSYPTGQIGFLLCKKCSKSGSSTEDVEHRFREMVQAGTGTTYYQPKLQKSSFDLPLWVEKSIYGELDQYSNPTAQC